MQAKTQRRVIAVILLFGGPIVGWLLGSDRGLLLGLVASLLAVAWIAIEERKWL